MKAVGWRTLAPVVITGLATSLVLTRLAAEWAVITGFWTAAPAVAVLGIVLFALDARERIKGRIGRFIWEFLANPRVAVAMGVPALLGFAFPVATLTCKASGTVTVQTPRGEERFQCVRGLDESIHPGGWFWVFGVGTELEARAKDGSVHSRLVTHPVKSNLLVYPDDFASPPQLVIALDAIAWDTVGDETGRSCAESAAAARATYCLTLCIGANCAGPFPLHHNALVVGAHRAADEARAAFEAEIKTGWPAEDRPVGLVVTAGASVTPKLTALTLDGKRYQPCKAIGARTVAEDPKQSLWMIPANTSCL